MADEAIEALRQEMRAEFAALRAAINEMRSALATSIPASASARGKHRPLIPNAETIAALEAVRRDEVKSFATIKDLFVDLHSDADD